MTEENNDQSEMVGDKKSSIEMELNALMAVVKSLDSLSPEGRNWVLASAASKFGVQPPSISKAPSKGNVESASQQSEGDGLSSIQNPKVKKWIKDAQFTEEELESVFYSSGSEYQIIASDVPGTSKKDKTINAYILVGASRFLETGEPNFTDQEARVYCETIGCYDSTNHAKYMKDKGNYITGNKNSGWTLTMPGLKAAVEVIRGAK